jgi:hypothetical protein
MKQINNWIQFLKENITNNVWYRGYTTKTKNNEFVWITSNENHAKEYAELNKVSYGGEQIIDKFLFDEYQYNLLDIYVYDMDDMITESDADDFLNDVDIEYDYENIFFDYDDEIPLSRLVNKILNEIISNYDGFKIMESGIKTIYLNKNLLKTY